MRATSYQITDNAAKVNIKSDNQPDTCKLSLLKFPPVVYQRKSSRGVCGSDMTSEVLITTGLENNCINQSMALIQKKMKQSKRN